MIEQLNIYDNLQKQQELFILSILLSGNNAQVYGTLNGKYQLYKKFYYEGKNLYLIVIYQSQQYNKYNLVAIKLINSKSIYGKIDVNNLNTYGYRKYNPINTDFLDLYYNTVFKCDDLDFYLIEDIYDERISELIGLDTATNIATFENVYLNQDEDDGEGLAILPLYYVSGNDLIVNNFSQDNPNEFTHNWNHSSDAAYEYYIIDSSYDNLYQSSIDYNQYDVQVDLSYLFNYSFNNINDIANISIINNEQAFFNDGNVSYDDNLEFNLVNSKILKIQTNNKYSSADVLPDNLYDVIMLGNSINHANYPENTFDSTTIYDYSFMNIFSSYNLAMLYNSNIMKSQYLDKLNQYPTKEINFNKQTNDIVMFDITLKTTSQNSTIQRRWIIANIDKLKIKHSNAISNIQEFLDADLYYICSDSKSNKLRYYIQLNSYGDEIKRIHLTYTDRKYHCIDGYNTNIHLSNPNEISKYSLLNSYSNEINYTWDICQDLNYNIINDSTLIFDDFQITGFVINETESSSAKLNELMTESYKDFKDKINNFISNDFIDVKPQPLNSIYDSKSRFKHINIAPISVISYVYDNLYSQSFIRSKYRNGGFNDIISVRDNLNSNILDNTNLSQSDRVVYANFCKNFSNVNYSGNYYEQKHYFLVENKITGEKEIIDLYTNVNLYGELAIQEYWYSYSSSYKSVGYYSDSTIDAVTYFGCNLYFKYLDYNDYWFTKLKLGSIDNLIGKVTNIELGMIIKNFTNGDTITLNDNLTLNDFTNVGNDYLLDLVNFVFNVKNKPNYYPIRIDVKCKYETTNNGFSYYERPKIYVFTVFDNISQYRGYSIYTYNKSQSGSEEDIREIRCNIQDDIALTLIPQTSYSVPLSLEVFDISEHFENFVPNNKEIIFLNNYIGNNINSVTLNDLTNVTDYTDIFILDKLRTEYDRYTNLLKDIPFIGHENYYCRMYLSYDIPNESEYLFDSFELINTYNNSLYDSTLGVIYLEGKVSDYTDNMNFDDLFKIYKVINNFTITENVPVSLNVPVTMKLTFRFYNTYEDFTNNTDFTEILYDDFVEYRIINRGDAMTTTDDQFPKLLYIIEYYEIYPQYSQQHEVDYIYTLHFNIKSEFEDIKVSEVYFDILHFTEDILVGIPVDYSSVDDLENAIDIEQVNSKDKILNYINYLIRHKCQNCTEMSYKIKIKMKPKYFGLNISGITFASYTYNIKFEQYIPYVFYKESADTVMLLQKSSTVDKTNVPIDLQEISDILHGIIDDKTLEKLNINESNFIRTSELPTESKLVVTVFNSSSNPKNLKLEMYNNSSPINVVDSTIKEFNLAPFDIRQVTITQDLNPLNYSNTYNSGLIQYKLLQKNANESEYTEVYNSLELPIPTLDEYISKFMSIIERASFLVDTRQSKHVINPLEKKEQKDINIDSVKIDSFADTNYNKITSGYYAVDNLKDFYMQNQKFVVTVDYDMVNYFVNKFSSFGNKIKIKIPYVITRKYNFNPGVQSKIEYLNNNLELHYNLTNYYDQYSEIQLYLVGQRTDVNRWEFKVEGQQEFIDSTILDNVSALYDLNEITQSSIDIMIVFPSIRLILESFFNMYGDSGYQYIYNNFINIDYFTDTYDNIMSNFIDMLASKTKDINNKTPFDTLRLQFRFEKSDIGSVISNNIKLGFSADVEDGENNYLGCCWLTIDEYPYDCIIYDCSFFNDIKQFNLQFGEKYDIKGNADKIVNVDDWLFDDVENVLYNTRLYQLFMVNKSLIVKPKIECKSLYNNVLDVNVTIDNNKERVNFIEIIDENDNKGTINNGGKYYFNENTNYTLNVHVDNLKFYNMKFTVDTYAITAINIIYPVQEELYSKLQKKPVYVASYYNEEEDGIIIQTTNYTKIFEIPFILNKSLDSYITINKIDIVENNLYNNDYVILFGDLNERYCVRASNNKASLTINKNIDKYSKGLKFVVSAYNIPNTTGQYYTTILIYYTFNGQQYVYPLDITYKVVLPNSLDNEQLIYTVEKVDGVSFSYSEKKDIENYYKKVTCMVQNNYLKGTSGCLSREEFTKWFK